MTKFKIGDQVRVIKYGNPIWFEKSYYKEKPKINKPLLKETEDKWWFDGEPNMVGKIGIIDGIADFNQDYSIKFKMKGAKCAWYKDEQLELYNGKAK